MAIENRNLEAGTRLVADYKKHRHVCTVEETEGKATYMLEDGRRFASLSSAGKAVMGGVACNGWRFWSVEGTEAEPGPSREGDEPPVARTKAKRLIRRTPNQKGAPEGQVSWFCHACMRGFLAAKGEEPSVCPEGHRVDDPQYAMA